MHSIPREAEPHYALPIVQTWCYYQFINIRDPPVPNEASIMVVMVNGLFSGTWRRFGILRMEGLFPLWGDDGAHETETP